MLAGALAKMNEWADAEDALVRDLYPRAPWAELLAALPGRSRNAIVIRARKFSIKREVREPSRLSAETRAKLADLARKNKPRLGKVLYPIIERGGVSGKFCSGGCGWKPLAKFARQPDCSGGVRNCCTTCEGRAAYRSNPELRKAAVRRYQKAHPEAHNERKRASNRRRHGQKIAGRGVKVSELREMKAQYGGLCAYCGTTAADTWDHVVPLSRGGLHQIENLLPACRACNFEKHNKTPEEWSAFRAAKEA